MSTETRPAPAEGSGIVSRPSAATLSLPRAEETSTLSLQAFKDGQFEYLRVLQAQRAAGELSGLLLEKVWPPVPRPLAPKPLPPPRQNP